MNHHRYGPFTISGKGRSWAVTGQGDPREFFSLAQAKDWVVRHQCPNFLPDLPDGYTDICANCGGHVTMHPNESEN